MGRYRSLQSIMLAEALKGITDNQTITAYKKDCKLFAAYCKEQGVKRPDQLQGKEKELLLQSTMHVTQEEEKTIMRGRRDTLHFVTL